MPAGLDGNPNPIRTSARTAVLERVASAALARRRPDRVLLVAVDGRPGAGKSTFADELARVLSDVAPVIRSTTDSFHHPRAVRWRLGRESPDGYFRDSFDLETLRRDLLDPMRQGAGAFHVARFDEPTDTRIDEPPAPVDTNSILVFDGLFLHRTELRHYWDFSVFLDADLRHLRDAAARAARESPSGGIGAMAYFARFSVFAHRYWSGWKLYLDECEPRDRAIALVDNNELAEPKVLRLMPAPTRA